MARGFVALIGIGALLGLAVAFAAVQHYRADFIERTSVGAWTLVLALPVAGLVATGSTVRHALAAMQIRPAQALRE